MEPIYAAIVAALAFVLLGLDFWRDKRRTERKEKVGLFQILPDGGIKPYNPDPIGGTTNEAQWNRNIGVPLGHGHEPQAYYRIHGDLYILPLRMSEWETVRYALNTMPSKTLYTGDRNVIIRRMENVEK